MRKLPVIRTEKDIEGIVEEFGFLPFFRSAIPGFSIEEMADQSVCFPKEGEGVWDWKDPVIRNTGASYGKFFMSHPGFVSKDLFPVLAAYRRDDYDFEGMVNDGLVTHTERILYSILEETGSETSTFLRYKANLSKSAFDTSNSRLQMRTFIIISGFEYNLTKAGKPYGWGIARYALPEHIYPGFEESLNSCRPNEARKILFSTLRSKFPETEAFSLNRLIG